MCDLIFVVILQQKDLLIGTGLATVSLILSCAGICGSVKASGRVLYYYSVLLAIFLTVQFAINNFFPIRLLPIDILFPLPWFQVN
jgi:hypothetical protein